MGNPTFPMVITLDKPVKLTDDAMISKLELREPLAGDYRTIKQAGDMLNSALDLVAEIADVPVAVIDKLSYTDTRKVVEAVHPFLFWFN